MLTKNDNNLYPHFSDSELASRYERVRASMQEAGISALLRFWRRILTANLAYATNKRQTSTAIHIS